MYLYSQYLKLQLVKPILDFQQYHLRALHPTAFTPLDDKHAEFLNTLVRIQ